MRRAPVSIYFYWRGACHGTTTYNACVRQAARGGACLSLGCARQQQPAGSTSACPACPGAPSAAATGGTFQQQPLVAPGVLHQPQDGGFAAATDSNAGTELARQLCWPFCGYGTRVSVRPWARRLHIESPCQVAGQGVRGPHSLDFFARGQSPVDWPGTLPPVHPCFGGVLGSLAVRPLGRIGGPPALWASPAAKWVDGA